VKKASNITDSHSGLLVFDFLISSRSFPGICGPNFFLNLRCLQPHLFSFPIFFIQPFFNFMQNHRRRKHVRGLMKLDKACALPLPLDRFNPWSLCGFVDSCHLARSARPGLLPFRCSLLPSHQREKAGRCVTSQDFFFM
jgi:hypothetical protein